MMNVTVGVVKYIVKNDYYIVGDNKTEQSGITDPSYSGEIVIDETIRGNEVKEIGYHAIL